MKTFSATTTINAPAEKIWQLLTDAPKYQEWDTNMIRIEGNITPGGKIAPYTKLSPDRAFSVTIKEFVPNKKMTWIGGMPLGLFKSERTFLLESLSGNQTKFTTREEFSGLLLPIFGSKLPDLNPIFATFVEGLKKRAESD